MEATHDDRVANRSLFRGSLTKNRRLQTGSEFPEKAWHITNYPGSRRVGRPCDASLKRSTGMSKLPKTHGGGTHNADLHIPFSRVCLANS